MRAEGELPSEEWIPEEDLGNHTECITQQEEDDSGPPQFNQNYYYEL
jgi:hypothetical protein